MRHRDPLAGHLGGVEYVDRDPLGGVTYAHGTIMRHRAVPITERHAPTQQSARHPSRMTGRCLSIVGYLMS